MINNQKKKQFQQKKDMAGKKNNYIKISYFIIFYKII